MSAVWTDQEIEVAVQPMDGDTDEPSGPPTTTTIEALVWGTFAVHEPVTSFIGGVTVTHIPTGLALVQSAMSERAARRFCEEVASVLDWDALKPDGVKALPNEVKAAIRAAMRKAQGVES